MFLSSRPRNKIEKEWKAGWIFYLARELKKILEYEGENYTIRALGTIQKKHGKKIGIFGKMEEGLKPVWQ